MYGRFRVKGWLQQWLALVLCLCCRMDHYLFGRDISVADIITAHLTCSKQHAVLQFRRTSKADALGLMSEAVRHACKHVNVQSCLHTCMPAQAPSLGCALASAWNLEVEALRDALQVIHVRLA